MGGLGHLGSFAHSYQELGGGEFPSLSWDEASCPRTPGQARWRQSTASSSALPPWTVRNIRFDETLGQLLHGYDFDFCLQVREAGRKVVTEDFKVVHHHSLELAGDLEKWVQAT